MSIQLITPDRFSDSRGWFSETWNRSSFEKIGIFNDFCQDNHSLSTRAGTLRGLHFQAEPFAQAKLVRCLKGRIFDVAVDIRHESPTYKKWVGVELTAASGNQLFIPTGYAHGFLTLEDYTEVLYKVDASYAAQADGGIAWDDRNVAVEWPLSGHLPILSQKDSDLPKLDELDCKFAYNGCPLFPVID